MRSIQRTLIHAVLAVASVWCACNGESDDASDGASTISTGGTPATPACPTEYSLDSYQGDVEGLCPAAEAAWCYCDEIVDGEINACAPTGEACCHFQEFCTRGVVCGWVDCYSEPAACKAYGVAGAGGEAAEPCTRCVSDADCRSGMKCNRRLANIMVCGPE